MRLSLHHVVVFAPDLEAAREFYSGVLGLSVQRAGHDCVMLDGPNFTLTIFPCIRSGEVSGYSQTAGSAIVFCVPSLDAAVAELRAKGVRVLHSTPSEGPVGRYVAFSDPFGTVLELLEERDRDETS